MSDWTCMSDKQYLILENSSESIVIINLNGMVEYMNYQARLIFDCQDYTAMHYRDVLRPGPKNYGTLLDAIDQSITSHLGWQCECSLTVQGQSRFFRHRFKPLVLAGKSQLMPLCLPISPIWLKRESKQRRLT